MQRTLAQTLRVHAKTLESAAMRLDDMDNGEGEYTDGKSFDLWVDVVVETANALLIAVGE